MVKMSLMQTSYSVVRQIWMPSRKFGAVMAKLNRGRASSLLSSDSVQSLRKAGITTATEGCLMKKCALPVK
jgi:hypothetical protein